MLFSSDVRYVTGAKILFSILYFRLCISSLLPLWQRIVSSETMETSHGISLKNSNSSRKKPLVRLWLWDDRPLTLSVDVFHDVAISSYLDERCQKSFTRSSIYSLHSHEKIGVIFAEDDRCIRLFSIEVSSMKSSSQLYQEHTREMSYFLHLKIILCFLLERSMTDSEYCAIDENREVSRHASAYIHGTLSGIWSFVSRSKMLGWSRVRYRFPIIRARVVWGERGLS